MDVSCQCRSVQFRLPTPQPLAVFHCHCRECRRQSSSAYGTSAVFSVADMRRPGTQLLFDDPILRRALSVYIRPGERSRSGRDMACYFCTRCGARVMHRYLKKRAGEVADGCGGGGDLGGTHEGGGDEAMQARQVPELSAALAVPTAPAAPTVDSLTEDCFDGSTVTIKGGLIAQLDYASAVHIYTEHAVVPIPANVKQYPGTPPG